jgi:hypothetical protein
MKIIRFIETPAKFLREQFANRSFPAPETPKTITITAN